MAIFVKFGSLEGEVTAKGYEKWLEVNSFQWGVGRGISAGVGGGSKREATAPSVSEITMTKSMDAFSPLMLKEAIGGDAKQVKIHMTQTDGKGVHVAYQVYILENTLISGYSLSSGGDRPTESFSINFTKFDSEYIKVDDKFKSTTTGHVIYDLTTASPA
jgi:type VI secretion system secreted protein Hcp